MTDTGIEVTYDTRMKYKLKRGCDGQWYAVFESEAAAKAAAPAFMGCRLVSFGGHLNAWSVAVQRETER